MGTVSFRLEGDEANAVQAFLRLTDVQKKAQLEAMRLGEKSKEAGEKLTGMGKQLESAFTDIKGMLVGGGILGAVMKVTSELLAWNQHLLSIKGKLGEMAGGSAGAQQRMLALATQEGVSPEEASRRVLSTSLKTGATPELSAEVRRSVHSTMGGDAAIGKGIQDVIAGTLARTGGTPEQATMMAEMLSRIPGATDTKESAASVLSQLESAMGQTYFATPGEVAQALGGGGLGGFLEGADVKKAMARQAQARAVTKNRETSVEMMRQIDVALKKDDARGMIEEETGKNYLELSYDQRFEAFQSAVDKRVNDPQALDDYFQRISEPTERQRMKEFFVAPQAKKAYADAYRSMVNAPSSGSYLAKNQAFLQSNVAQSNVVAARKESGLANLPSYEDAVGLLHTAAEGKLGAMRAMGKVGYWADKFQLESTQLEAAEYAVQLERLGEKPRVAPGTINSDIALRFQLIEAKKKRGIPTPVEWPGSAKTIIGEGGILYTPAGPQVPGTPASQPATVINNHYGDVYATSRDKTALPASAPQIRK